MYAKRIWIALLLGILTGGVCAFTSMSGLEEDQKTMVFISALLNRAFIGFVIGISAWRIGWVWHGILIGLLGSLPLSFPLIWAPEAGFTIFVMYTIAGMVWGFLIELFTTVVFKAPMKAVLKED